MQYIDKTELPKKITAWGNAGAKWAKDGQTLALSCLKQLADHGDVGFVTRLYLAMPKGTKSSAMASWLLTHGALVANTEKDKKDKPFKFSREKTTDMEAAAADPWYDHKPEPDADKVLDLQAAIQALIKKAKKASQVEHSELLEQLQAMVSETPAGQPTDEPTDE